MGTFKKACKKGVAFTLAAGMCVSGITVPTVSAAKKVPVTDDLAMYLDMESAKNGSISDDVTGEEFSITGKYSLEDSRDSRFGSALKFDGSTYVNLGKALQPKNEYTIMGWMKMDEGGKQAQSFISRGHSGDVSNQLATLIKNNQIYHCVSVANGGGNESYQEFSGGSVPKETWKHVAITRSRKNITYYVDGKKAYQTDQMYDADFAACDWNYYLGTDENSSGQVWDEHMFTGLMDEIRLYTKALTQEEIAETAGLVAEHKITEAENGTLKISFANTPETEPVQEDFELVFGMEGQSITPVIQTYTYDADKREAVFTFEPLENESVSTKTVHVTATYHQISVSSSFELEGKNNSAPSISDVQVVNLSTKLGDEPHVKGMLKAEYTFEDPDGDAEGDTEYQWYIADEKDGAYEKLEGIRTQTVILLEKYVDKYLKCEITAKDIHGNKAESISMSPVSEKVMPSEGNPLTDWFLEAQFGVSHHLLSEFVNLDFVSTKPEEKWNPKEQTWNEFIGQFDAEAYAKQISQTGAQFVIITLGQNAAEYCAPNLVYDKYLREAGLLKEGETNPKTVSFENDLPMKLANALEPYGIKVMLYLPSNVPHSAHWDSDARDYLITEKALKGQRGSNGPNRQEAKKILCEMVEWWSLHYGDKISGWWFDGMYPGGILESQNDMKNKYNVSSLANAAKAGNPYNIISFNQGTSVSSAFGKNTEYHDYTAGEQNNFNQFPVDGRWAKGTTDCQNFQFGPLGTGGWGWGAAGLSHDIDYVETQARKSIEKQYVLGFDVKVNHFGEVDSEQLDQLIQLKANLKPVSKNTLNYFLSQAKDHVANGDVDDCIESIKKLFEEAIAEGEEVMAKERATYEEVTQATAKLMKAIQSLGMKAADKADLEMAIELAHGIDLSKYVEAGQAEFQKALAEAERVLADGDAMQKEVDAAWNALVDAISNLRLKADKSTLDDLLDSIKNLDLDKYTKESVTVLKKAVAKANEVMADETLSEDDQKVVDDAEKALAAAIDGLKFVSNDEGHNNDNDNGSNSTNGGNNSGTPSDGNKDNNKDIKKDASKTGDAMNIATWMMLMSTAIGATGLEIKRRKRS